MSRQSLETLIVFHARVLFENSRLRVKDIMEWNTKEFTPDPGEVVMWIPDPGVWVSIKQVHDKRRKNAANTTTKG